MTRIISGKLGSLRLKTAAKSTRPTSDRVKESLFSKLENIDAIEGTRVLDLFAGTGALGFESLSRGAVELTAIEKNPQAAELLRENARLIEEALSHQGLATKITVKAQTAEKFLSTATEASFDLIFLDPPYEYSNADLEKLLLALARTISKESLIVVERSSKSDEPNFGEFEVEDEKTYGDTKVYFLRTN